MLGHDGGFCAALPVTSVVVMVVYCHHHQAYRLDTYLSHQEGHDEPQSGLSTTVDFGPFDTSDDVLAFATERLGRALLLLPAVPGSQHLED